MFSTWLRSYKNSSAFARRITDGVFYLYHHRVIERILDRKPRVLIAASGPGDLTIFGYLVLEKLKDSRNVAHFVYVKKQFRGQGVMRRLFWYAGVKPGECLFTHWTNDVDKLIAKWPTAVYNPYFL